MKSALTSCPSSVYTGVAAPRAVTVNRRLRIDIPTLLLVSLSGGKEMTAFPEKTTSTTPQFITEREISL